MLTVRQVKFAQEYVIYGVGTKAAKSAGYKSDNPNSLKVMASQLLSNIEIQLYIEALKIEAAKVAKVRREEVINEIALIAFYNIADLMKTDGSMKPLSDLNRDVSAAVESIVIITDRSGSRISKVKMASKLKALDRLSKYFNICNSTELSGQEMVVNFTGKFLNV